MGFFSNVASQTRVNYLTTAWIDIVKPLRATIMQRGVSEEFNKSIDYYFDQAIAAARVNSLKGQIKGAKKSILSAYSIKDSNIVDSCALYTVAIFVEVYCRLKEDSTLIPLYLNLLDEIESSLLSADTNGKARSFKEIVGSIYS